MPVKGSPSYASAKGGFSIGSLSGVPSGKKAKGQPSVSSPSLDGFAQRQSKPMTKLKGQVK